MSNNRFNQQQAEAFAGRVVGILNEGALAHLVSIGHQTGLFDTMSILPPATSGQIAEAAGLNERYVREWLNGLTVGEIISYQPENQTYQLPPEHAAALTRAAGADNLAVYSQHVSQLGAVETQIVDCFRNGGGVPYESFHRFHEIMAEDSNLNVVSVLIDQILPLVPGLPERLAAGIAVLDVGCGRGNAVREMARHYPHSDFTGYDLSQEAIAFARAAAAEAGLENVRFDMKDTTYLDEVRAYDLITAFDAIHDQGFPARVLDNIHTALKPDGLFLMQDIAASSHVHKNGEHPLAPFLYTISTMHCMTVSLAQGGAGLGTMWGRETAQRMLAEAGFGDVEVHQLPHDVFNDYYLCRLA